MTALDHPVRTDAETQTRRDLAALYRLVAHFRMTDLIDTHISARIPGTPDHFLINRYGVLFHEMGPDDLVKIDTAGKVVDAADAGQRVNAAGFTIHSAVHMARHDLACVIHTHTADGIAVSCQQEGLLPISQHALKFYGHLGYHAYEGIALDLEERARLVASLGEHRVMILRNHGLLAAGRTIAEAFQNIYFLERACQAQVKATSSGRPLSLPPQAVCERTAAQFNREEGLAHAQMAWESALRLIA
ncbi:class II aldolase/adducin family protein [Variovorax boronicumulans]|jgi:ribulose-5-phosphate 4-epimerase/fuculose-1-phosphate aldolase|uniref:class II aldolase/adducin family protein n=1 Tax=Variovorax boronicumulans TaxID=436515 RepID=UPI001C58BE50